MSPDLGTLPSRLQVEKCVVTEKGRATFASQISRNSGAYGVFKKAQTSTVGELFS